MHRTPPSVALSVKVYLLEAAPLCVWLNQPGPAFAAQLPRAHLPFLSRSCCVVTLSGRSKRTLWPESEGQTNKGIDTERIFLQLWSPVCMYLPTSAERYRGSCSR